MGLIRSHRSNLETNQNVLKKKKTPFLLFAEHMLGEIFRDKSLFYKSFPYVQLSDEMKKKNNEKDD